MAALVRTFARQGVRILSSTRHKQLPALQKTCFISTTKKNTDSATLSGSDVKQKVVEEESTKEREDWMSFGYDMYSEEYDIWAKNMVMFFGFTVCLVGGGFIIAYFPDHRLQDWSQREAYLELHRRQTQGLPLVDANLIHADKIEPQLPSDDDLGDMEIIV